MTLVADEQILTQGTIEECMYASNSMSFAERDTYSDIWIQEEADVLPFPTKVAELKINGKEQPFSLKNNKKTR